MISYPRRILRHRMSRQLSGMTAYVVPMNPRLQADINDKYMLMNKSKQRNRDK